MKALSICGSDIRAMQAASKAVGLLLAVERPSSLGGRARRCNKICNSSP
jgi:hypothetical protein